MKAPRIPQSVILLLLVSAVSLWAADVSGTWHTGLPGRMGNTRPYTFELAQAADGTLSGKVIGFRSEGAIQDGHVDGNKVRFSAENMYQARRVLMTFEGTYEGNTMKLAVTFSDNDNQIDITANRD